MKLFNFFKFLFSNFEREKDRVKSRFFQLLFNLGSALVVGLSVGTIVMAFNNPPGNPTTGGGIIGAASGAPASSLYIDSTGKVGIGTTSPAAKFHILSSTSGETTTSFVQNSSNTANSQAREILRVAGSSAGDSYTVYDIDGVISWAIGTDNSDADKFKIATGGILGTSDDKLTIQSDGNVGIGTTSPDHKLDVNGKVRANSFYSGSSGSMGLNATTNLVTGFSSGFLIVVSEGYGRAAVIVVSTYTGAAFIAGNTLFTTT
ncbi:MAG: hypothetical protein WC475_01080 [Candidatus Paceibacterota bacterium]